MPIWACMSLYGLHGPDTSYPYDTIFRYCPCFTIFWYIWNTFSFDTMFIDIQYIETGKNWILKKNFLLIIILNK